MYRVIRVAILLLILAAVAIPLGEPILAWAASPDRWQAWSEYERLGGLLLNTAYLLFGAVALALPVGVMFAIILYRTNLPGAENFRRLVVLALFIPLPLLASAWQGLLGSGGVVPGKLWVGPSVGYTPSGTTIPWQPWIQGLSAAIWLHGIAGLPWVIWIVGLGLRYSDRRVEEDALLHMSAPSMFLQISLPRCAFFVWASAFWVGLQAMTEISVTDVMQVRTLAEEVYTQLVVGDEMSVIRAVGSAVPMIACTVLLFLYTALQSSRFRAPMHLRDSRPLNVALGRFRVPACILAILLCMCLIGVPLLSLIWRTGQHGQEHRWAWAMFSQTLVTTIQIRWRLVANSLLLAVGAGLIAVVTAVIMCLLLVGKRYSLAILLILTGVALAEPAPVVGLGLKRTIALLLDASHSSVLARLLYFGPSLLPLLWAQLVRFFPVSFAIMWPTLRTIPREIHDNASLDGANAWQQFYFVILPLVRRSAIQAAVATAILSLGELAAGKLVETPGTQTLIHEIFNQMHYGVTNDVAALSLLLLAMIVAAGGGAWGLTRMFTGRMAGR